MVCKAKEAILIEMTSEDTIPHFLKDVPFCGIALNDK